MIKLDQNWSFYLLIIFFLHSNSMASKNALVSMQERLLPYKCLVPLRIKQVTTMRGRWMGMLRFKSGSITIELAQNLRQWNQVQPQTSTIQHQFCWKCVNDDSRFGSSFLLFSRHTLGEGPTIGEIRSWAIHSLGASPHKTQQEDRGPGPLSENAGNAPMACILHLRWSLQFTTGIKGGMQ